LQGRSEIFDVFVKNPTDEILTNLILLIRKIPKEWTYVKPKSVSNVNPNETVVFMVNLSIPEDVDVKDYPISMYAISKETHTEKESLLKVSAVPKEIKILKEFPFKLVIFYFVITFIIVILIIFIVIKIREGTLRKERQRILDKIFK